ncbi:MULTISPECIES: YbjQ family protein [Psychrobacter]|uniref:YbjQ family protein n=1 Tax=Psychrobacter TaxID=497 RepID=UPI000ED592CA|nr:MULTISPECIES: heavy metal-binding domain-containing protein [Psychrobacter]MBE8609458.1 heavy metal-binding domain-containing protein [Pseudomonas lundensis]MCG3808184.1 heavy metal-binding domain-containing protein [Psychrobacter sp. Ps4]HCI75455.1 metal-binding protein [Psychrobacter sp.]
MNNSLTQMLINYAPFILLFAAGWFFGSRHERQHLAQLSVAEQELSHIMVSSERFYVPKLVANTEGELVLGSVVIAQDYFKMIIARLLSIFGKNLTTYETLLDRARREALVRMRTEAQAKGYNHIYGLRLEVSNINQLGSMVEAIAYGTAVISTDRH